MTAPRRWERYVALGDSSTEGLEDPDGRGGYRGWADRLAARIAAEQGGLQYANLGVRGRRARQILEQQVPPALAMAPDLVTLFAGTNDATREGFDPTVVGADLARIFGTFTAIHATVITFTLPDLTNVLPRPVGRRLAPHIEGLAQATRSAAAATGAVVVDFARYPIATDLRYWHPDRFHANPRGHALIAEALAHALGVPGAKDILAGSGAGDGQRGESVVRRVAGDLWWAARYLIPYLWRHSQGRSTGDGRGPKRPGLAPVFSTQATSNV